MKRRFFGLFAIVLVLCLLATGCGEEEGSATEESSAAATTVPTTTMPSDEVEWAKPVIYLYPEQPTEVAVQLHFDGELTCTYPAYEDGWIVTAHPDGTLIDSTGKQYNYLYWEGSSDAAYDLSEGFVVAGDDTAAFLEETLAKLGLTPREANEFIVYWLPQMQENAYNLITFQQEVYTSHAPLTITPAPDSLLRVFMVYQPLEQPVDIPTPALETFERQGFAVVEWGGCRLSMH